MGSTNLPTDLRIAVILASVRQGRRGETYTKWIHELLPQRDGVASELLEESRDHQLPPYEHAEMPPAIEGHYADQVERRWSEKSTASTGSSS